MQRKGTCPNASTQSFLLCWPRGRSPRSADQFPEKAFCPSAGTSYPKEVTGIGDRGRVSSPSTLWKGTGSARTIVSLKSLEHGPLSCIPVIEPPRCLTMATSPSRIQEPEPRESRIQGPELREDADRAGGSFLLGSQFYSLHMPTSPCTIYTCICAGTTRVCTETSMHSPQV